MSYRDAAKGLRPGDARGAAGPVRVVEFTADREWLGGARGYFLGL